MRGGIPQGSALGPLLFLIYVNSLPCQITEGILLQYADDTTLICSGPTPEAAASAMNSQLELVNRWATDSRMRLNFSKSTVMWFKTSKRTQRHYPPIVVGDVVLNVVTSQKYLGLVFDQNLSWDQHVSHICKRMSYYLYVIRCHRNVLSFKLLKLLAGSLVLSHFNYCLPIWGTSLHTHSLQRLKRMQNRAVQLCKNLKKYDHVSEHYKHLRWLQLESLIQYRSLCLMHHQFHQLQCIPLQPPIQFGRHHNYCTRTSSFFANLPRYHLTFSQRHFRYKTSQWWNGLPDDENFTAAFPFLFSCSVFDYLSK